MTPEHYKQNASLGITNPVLQRALVDPCDEFTGVGFVLREEVFYDFRDILPAVEEWRQLDRKDNQGVVEVLQELAVVHQLLEF